MVIKRAQKEDADIIGEVHSAAWKQTYQGVFSQEYLDSDLPSARREEFLNSLNDKNCVYLLLKEDDHASGIVKLLVNRNDIEVASFYILEEYRGRGFGRKILEYIFSEYKDRHFVLWVLETNLNARAFYEKCGFELTDKTRLIDRGGKFKQLMYERK
ncbi:GNAT family N-acetyltransferase [Pseudobutyrivibrio sp.]|jgi:ribosomal protein S18 acetylase RimI-like enzyme|uniref:GNAT family N-acetyltransferase n=1 Tax=Pseudobutyrivibrio sp. TaxID=2014367 RepID=UPI0025CD9FE7|nr:GNAT family N-acetyltransferase [Pseudobutyrivibrio sp.]